jgi:hypothetical protein
MESRVAARQVLRRVRGAALDERVEHEATVPERSAVGA